MNGCLLCREFGMESHELKRPPAIVLSSDEQVLLCMVCVSVQG
jgi:hypothetical protein